MTDGSELGSEAEEEDIANGELVICKNVHRQFTDREALEIKIKKKVSNWPPPLKFSSLSAKNCSLNYEASECLKEVVRHSAARPFKRLNLDSVFNDEDLE